METAPKAPEIDHRTIKLLIGLFAISLANLTSFYSNSQIDSISASYYEGGWAQSIFVGFLFAIAAFLTAYNGQSASEMVPAKIAAAAALGVALFPCQCGIHAETIPYVHGISAAVMFAILAWFCYVFYLHAKGKGHDEAVRRKYIYSICGILIVISMIVIGCDNWSGGVISNKIPRLTFYGERTGLVAFGISWLTASRIFPGLANREERLIFFGGKK